MRLHAVVYACLTTSFFTIARTGEFMVSPLLSFDSLCHMKVSDMHNETDRNGFAVTTFHLPQTKTAHTGEDVYWAAQMSPADPCAALMNHFTVNAPGPSTALFSWHHRAGLWVLTKSAFLKCLQDAGKCLGQDNLKGHGIRIGGTLEYLLRGVLFESVKAMGRWNSDVTTQSLNLSCAMCYPRDLVSQLNLTLQ